MGGGGKDEGERAEQGSGRMGQNTALTRRGFFGRGAFLTLFPQPTCAAMANPSSIQDTQGAVALRSAFLRVKRTVSGTAQRAIGLQRKSRAGKASSKGRFGPAGRTIDGS